MVTFIAFLGGLIVGFVAALTLAVLIAASVVITSLRRENDELVDALTEEESDERQPGEHFEVVRQTPNFMYLRDLVTDERQIQQIDDIDDDTADRFWVETGMFSTSYTSPLED